MVLRGEACLSSPFRDGHKVTNVNNEHRGFARLCAALLVTNKRRDRSGDSSSWQSFVNRSVHKMMWEEGWLQFLDDVCETGTLEDMGIYLQEAAHGIYRLKSDLPELHEHCGGVCNRSVNTLKCFA